MLAQSEVGPFLAFEIEILEVLLGGETGETGRDWEGLGGLGGVGSDWEILKSH